MHTNMAPFPLHPLFKLFLPVFFPFDDEVDAVGKRREDASCGSLEGDGLTTEVDIVWADMAVGVAGPIHSHGEPSKIGGAVMEEVWLAECKGVIARAAPSAAGATVSLGGKSRRGGGALGAAAVTSVFTATAIGTRYRE